jgi:RNA polymerase sigma-70 factor (ECF subfamily)
VEGHDVRTLMNSKESSSTVFSDETLFAELFTPLFRYLFFRTRDHEIANDLTQAVFLKFLLQKEKPEEKEHAHRLLFTIARTTLIDHYRVKGRRLTVSIDEVPEFPSEIASPLEEAVLDDEKRFIGTALAQLSADEAEIVALRLSGEVSYDTIAHMTGISVANARQIYSRALKKVTYLLDVRDFVN